MLDARCGGQEAAAAGGQPAAALELHPVHHWLAGQVAPDLARDQAVAALPHARHRAAGVRRYQHARRAPQRVALARQSSVSWLLAWLVQGRALQGRTPSRAVCLTHGNAVGTKTGRLNTTELRPQQAHRAPHLWQGFWVCDVKRSTDQASMQRLNQRSCIYMGSPAPEIQALFMHPMIWCQCHGMIRFELVSKHVAVA